MEHPALIKSFKFLFRHGPYLYVLYLLLYRALKLNLTLDIGGLSWYSQVTTELDTSFLKQAISTLTLKDFETIVDCKKVSKDDSTLL